MIPNILPLPLVQFRIARFPSDPIFSSVGPPRAPTSLCTLAPHSSRHERNKANGIYLNCVRALPTEDII